MTLMAETLPCLSAAGPRLRSTGLRPPSAIPEGEGVFAVDAVIRVGD